MMDFLIGLACLWHRLLVRLNIRSDAEASHLEVERKFSISQAEAQQLPDRLSAVGFAHFDDVHMTDKFLPAPDGEMKRIRVELGAKGRRYLLTRKYWVEVSGGKERHETEVELGAFSQASLLLVGEHINGEKLLCFSKHRRLYVGTLNGVEAVVSIDSVEGLGQYSGFYLEVEVLVPVGRDVELARASIISLVAELLGEVRQPVKHSYMDMLKQVSNKNK